MTDGMKRTLFDAAERFGVPVVVLGAVLWMFREAATSVHHTLIVPIVESHTQFLETTSETLHEIGKTQNQQAETLKELADSQKEIHRELTRSKSQ
jgi:hypothetical protein